MLDMDTKKTSNISRFYDYSIKERIETVANFAELNSEEKEQLFNFGNLSSRLANLFIENTISSFSLPLGLATNFVVNGKDYLVPMAVEESSVVAAASYGAKLARHHGGFLAKTTDNPTMTGQIQLFVSKGVNYNKILEEHKEEILNYGNQGQDRLISRGGGAKDITWYPIEELSCLVVLVHIATGDAMGANIVNSMCEKLSGFLSKLLDNCSVGLRILSNLTLNRVVESTCTIPAQSLHKEKGQEVVEQIISAWKFAWHDTLRATTHNKGVMNGIDPIIIATGNDWRATEAGAHAYAAQTGSYRPLTTWAINSDGNLVGKIKIPMAIGTVGGMTKLHPTAQTSLKILRHPNAQTLGEIIASVGLAQNLSALKALATEGIQRGHMHLHQRNIQERQKYLS